MFSQCCPDTTYIIKYPTGEVFKRIIIWGNSTHISEFTKEGFEIYEATIDLYQDKPIVVDTAFFYPNGRTLKKKISYKNGLLSSYKENFENGGTKYRGVYDDMGCRQGNWFFYNEESGLIEDRLYKDGAILEAKYYNKNEQIVKKYYNEKEEIIKTEYEDIITPDFYCWTKV